MSAEIPMNNPEKKEVLEDNARKFTLDTVDALFLEEHEAKSFLLTTDWLETGSDNEKKLAYKEFDTGEVQILLIAKVTKDGNRTSEKQKITKEEYDTLLESSVLHLEKKRYEFDYAQNGIAFAMKYDEFTDSPLRILEVDAATEEDRNAFDSTNFPGKLSEVTGQQDYYGYRVANIV